MEHLAIILIVLAGVKSAAVKDERTLSVFESEWPVGDPHRCQELSKLSSLDVQRFEVLPGIGWDNLRNLETGLVVTFNFSHCKVTDDGNFLIPDDVYTIPLKTSRVETFAEIIESWHEARSTTSDTINIEAGFSLGPVSIDGKFSYEHEHMKSTQIGDDSSTVRVQLRYHKYEVKLQPDPQLSPQFKSRLLTIAAQLELNQTEQARYSGQLLVRDFGTHVLTSVTAGAGLVKDDYLSRKFMSSTETDKKKILVSASASFFSIFHFSASYGHSTKDMDTETYKSSMTHSYIKTFGGPNFRTNMTVDEWASQVDANLVPMDRAGDPLYFFVTSQTLPELPSTTVGEVEKIVRESIETYYEMNTIRGCTKLDSPNFSFSANFDDGSCHTQYTNLTFGGVYQTCQLSGSFLNNNPCHGVSQVNPKTGSASCPPSYRAVQLLQGHRSGVMETRRVCHSCGIFDLFHCCHTEQYQATAIYTTYWCAAAGPVAQQSGYLFGGFYTGTRVNPVSGNIGCPKGFYALRLLYDMSICLSDDYEESTGLSVPFGGFYSCQSGNPLAVGGVQPVGEKLRVQASNSLKTFMGSHVGDESLPQKCPNGYSQHLVTMEMGCAVHFCARTNSLSGPMLPPIKRPPFTNKPASPVDNEHNMVMFNVESQTWVKDENIKQQELKAAEATMTSSTKQQHREISPAAAAVIATCGTVGCVAIATLISLVIYKRHQRRRGAYRRLTDETSEARVSYGSDDAGHS
ncbi:unnamed protein product [Lymnaea stagnalis]|uniref:MACPF domain-containing protein n=1 Tax=Lymnaea stagnalis TaxID=6523 RepID=A0AAV2HYJ3_LYMST